MTNAWAMIHRETGEIKELDSVNNRNAGYKEKMAKDNRNGRSRDFMNGNMQYLHEVYSVLTTPQSGYLMLLQCYVGWDNGIIVNPDKTPMTTSDMQRVLQLTGSKRSTFYDFFRSCTANNIVIANEDGSYSMNERYHFKGAHKNQFVVKTYTAKIKRVYKEVKASDIGLIYRMLPYVHMSTNALCADPFEKDPKKIRWFTQEELSEAIGVDARTLRRRLPKMQFDGEYVIHRGKVGNEPERYTLNHWVFYRQDNEPEATLQAMFITNKQD